MPDPRRRHEEEEGGGGDELFPAPTYQPPPPPSPDDSFIHAGTQRARQARLSAPNTPAFASRVVCMQRDAAVAGTACCDECNNVNVQYSSHWDHAAFHLPPSTVSRSECRMILRGRGGGGSPTSKILSILTQSITMRSFLWFFEHSSSKVWPQIF
ncbi:hypothetical protein E2C01_095127 [Portunus trituberculatus]|uniref:Uncharacterized protein n=1 Tax=Portunus trituberculatus TaxID=210409 RepID=A0A5B7JXZ6_PORTR|nr:hypothetical protein [Portunus trituberculatus]